MKCKCGKLIAPKSPWTEVSEEGVPEAEIPILFYSIHTGVTRGKYVKGAFISMQRTIIHPEAVTHWMYEIKTPEEYTAGKQID